jgi:PAS domain S-box-containing protein
MPRRKMPVALMVATPLVTVVTLLIGSFGMARYAADHDEKWARLRKVNAVEADVLAISLALPVWNIDRPQIDKILQSMEGTPSIQAVAITAPGLSQTRVRIGNWLQLSDGKLPSGELLVEERPIAFNNQRIGTVRLYATPRYIREELRQSLVRMIAGIAALDLLIIFAVYFVLWRTVLRPLVSLEKYAAAISFGYDAPAVGEFTATELETLRAAMETMVRGLREGERRFRTIFDSASDVIFLTDPATGRFLDVNARITEMFGYTREQALELDVGQLSSGIEPYTREGAMATIAGTLDGSRSVFEWQTRHRDGHAFWIEGSARTATIDDRKLLIVVVRDISERKEMERALKEETDFTEATINSIPGAFFVRDRVGRLVRWNEAMALIRGSPPEEMRSQIGLPMVHPSDRAAVEAAVQQVWDEGQTSGEARVMVDGEARHFLLNARRMDRGGESFLVGTGIDITERRRAEAERERLRRAVELSAVEWRQTFDSVQTPIIITDEQGVVRRVNERAAGLAGGNVETLGGTMIGALGRGPWSAAAELITAWAEGADHSGAEARDDLGRVWDVTVTPLVPGTREQALIVVFWEITGIVALQESLRRSERMSAMGALVAGVAHEVRNPLFGMTALLDAYADEMKNGELAQFAAGLRELVMRLIHLMRELLEFGRPVAIRLVPGSLRDVVEDAVGGRVDVAREAGVTLHNEVDAELPAVSMDYGRLRQVFENLIDNALQQAPALRRVTVAAREVVHEARPSIECTVADDGPGFRPDDLPAVFEPFFTRRERGTGLGLSIVQRIVEDHGGQVRAGNGDGGGAVITIVLPVARPMASHGLHFTHAAQQDTAGR